MRHHLWLLLAITMVASPALAVGPTPGSEVPELKAEPVAGFLMGDERNLAAETAAAIFVFIQADKFDRPMARFLSVLDQKLAKERADAHVFVVFLTDEPAKSKEYLPRAQESLKLKQTAWSVYHGEKTGPIAWNVDIASHLTAIVTGNGKVVKSFEYRSVNDSVVPKVYGELPTKQ